MQETGIFELLCPYYNLTVKKKQAYGMGFSTYLYIQTAEPDFLKSLICADLRPDYMIVGFKHFEMDEIRYREIFRGVGAKCMERCWFDYCGYLPGTFIFPSNLQWQGQK